MTQGCGTPAAESEDLALTRFSMSLCREGRVWSAEGKLRSQRR